jgi:NAD(P)-dependent dehydrogenase (short-subunit alcohol dehydrogenase family)
MGETATKVALITGANKGIGLETARQLGKLGITIVVGSRDLARGEAAAEVLRGMGVDARPIKLDVVKRADRVAAVKFLKKEFGRLDILINNAAVMLDPHCKRNQQDAAKGPARHV